MMKSGFAFIVSHIEISGDLPVQIVSDHVLRRARDEEVKEIEKLLPKIAWFVQYDAQVQQLELEGGAIQYSFKKLPK